ncbi:MAG: hypothetical protein H6659_14585 [Ardenticatenaceae bacterium]|nr:hypothetical protein [Ardenticatenaceae bacterium]
MNPFTDAAPFVIPSMNQVRLVDLPGVPIPLAWRSKTGYQLLGSRALAAQIRRQAGLFHLPANLPDADLIRRLDACFTEGDQTIHTAAWAVAEENGRKLALHLLTLLRGDPVNRAVRPDWQAEQWDFWAQIRTVYTGGGIMAGHLGPIAAATAQAFIRAHGFAAFTVAVPPHAAQLPLYGAARTAPADAAMLVFDFGQTAVKRAIAHSPHHLESLPNLPTPCARLPFGRHETAAAQTLGRLLDMVAETWTAVAASGVPLSSQIALVLACYLLDGQPRPEDWSCYGRLQQFTSHLETYLSQHLSLRLQRPIHAHLLHDGQAAAMPFAGQAHTAVITFGTALGIGFPPENDDSQLTIHP